MNHTSFLWSGRYADYEGFLYHSDGQVTAQLKTSDGKTFEIKKVVFGVLEEQPALVLAQRCAQPVFKNNIAVFPYPSLKQIDEVWVFEATPAAAPYLRKAKKTHQKEVSAKNYEKILTYLKTALKIDDGNAEIKKAVLDIKQKLFHLQVTGYANQYLSNDEEITSFLKMVKNLPNFEGLLGWVHAWQGEKQPHVYLMQAVVHEFLLDQPLLAADSYAHLAQVSVDTKALACMVKALSFFKKTDPVLNYAHFLEKIDRKFLEKYEEFEPILLRKDAIRMIFERALVLFAKLPPAPTCFICCNPQEEEVVSWVHHVLAFDLKKIGVCPIYASQDLTHINDYSSFQAKMCSANRALIICTPELKQKCTPESQTGVVQEVRLARQRYHNPEQAGGISLLYLQGNRQSSCPDPFFEPIFAGQYATSDHPIEKNTFNYYEMAFEFFAPMKGLSNLDALEIKERFIDSVKDILNGKIAQNEIDEWRKWRWEKKELGTLQDLQKIYSRLENTQPHIVIQKDLRAHYALKKHLSLLVSQKEIPIEQLYTRLTIIGEAEKKKKKEEAEDAKPGHSLDQLEDRRPLTHESIFEPENAIALEKLFNHEKLQGNTKRILIQGSAGIGKSTLCHHIAYRWAQKALFPQFDYLLWLPLRRLSSEICLEKMEWNGFIAQECGLESAQVRALFSNEETKKRILVLLDGYDELTADATNPNKRLYPILKALKEFPNVIITSRPQRIDFTANCTLEILGFDAKGIEEYVKHFFSQDQQAQAKSLRTQLQQPLVKSLSHIPINLEIFCSLAAADEPLFTTAESPTMTLVYIKLTDWLFRRFRIDRKQEDPASVLESKNPSRSRKVKSMVHALEQIAWKAMEKDTLYVDVDTIENIVNDDIGIDMIRDIGPLRIENGQGDFIHSTFQEYFAAVYLARLYVKNPHEAKKLLEEIKFEPHYRLVLSMTVGYLSQKAEFEHLQTFFNDLFSKPRDLAESYELSLFAQCFEECLTKHLMKISQYSRFIQCVVAYIKKAPLQEMNFRLLNRNTKLVCNPYIIATIVELMKSPKKQDEIFELLARLAREKLPPEVLTLLVQFAIDYSLDSIVRVKAVKALGEIAGSGQALFPEALTPALLRMASDASCDRSFRIKFIMTLTKFVGSGQALSPEALAVLVKIAIDSSLEGYVRGEAMAALGQIAGLGQALPPKVLNILAQLAIDSSLEGYVRGDAIVALGEIAGSGQVLPPEALIAVVKMANDSSLDRYVQGKAMETLGKIAVSGQAFYSEALTALVKAVSDSSFDENIRGEAIAALGCQIAVSWQASSPKALAALVKIAIDSSLERYVQGKAMEALGQIAGSEQALPFEALTALMKVASDSSLHGYVRGKAMEALSQIVGSGQALPSEALAALVKIASDSGDYIRKGAMRVLGQIARLGQALPPEALAALVKMASDSSLDRHVRGDAIAALGEIGGSGQALPPEALTALEKVTSDSSINKYVLGKAFVALGEIGGSGQILPPEVLTALVKIASDPSLERYVQRMVIEALGQIAGSGQVLPLELLTTLVKIANDSSFERNARRKAITAVGKIGGSRQALSPKALTDLVKIASKSSLANVQGEAMGALGQIGGSGQILPPEVLTALVEMASDSFLVENVRGKAIVTLGQIAGSGQEFSPKILTTLVNAVSDSSLAGYFRGKSIEALGEIAGSGQALPSEALKVLVKIASDSSLAGYFRGGAFEALKKIESSYLVQYSEDLVKAVCYLTHRAWVVSEYQLSISDGNCRIVRKNNEEERCSVQ